jgi:hypothetical protein
VISFKRQLRGITACRASPTDECALEEYLGDVYDVAAVAEPHFLPNINGAGVAGSASGMTNFDQFLSRC